MKSVYSFMQLPALVLTLLLLVSCVPTTGELEPSFSQEPGAVSDVVGYPAPTTEVRNAPTPSVAELSAYPAPLPSQQEKPTPWPSPVREDQLTPTAMPLSQPSNKTSGTLYFAGIDNGVLPRVFAVSVTNSQAIEGDKRQILPELLFSSTNPVRLYPSPTGDILAVLQFPDHGPGDIITMVNLGQNSIAPIHNNQDNEMPYLWQFEGWHPDGHHFLISDADHFKGLWLIDGQGIEKPEKLVEHNPDSASMSPTAQTLAYAYRPKLSNQSLLTLAWSDGSHPQVVLETSSRTPITELFWSPDGTSLAYVKGSAEIWVYNNGEHVRLADDYKAYSGYSWSPDSRFIAYTARTGANEKLPAEIDPSSLDAFKHSFGNTELHIIDTENLTIHVPNHQGMTGSLAPTWSPDGRSVIFISMQNGRLEVMKADVDNLDSMKVENMIDSEYMISAAVWVAPVEEE